VHKNKNDNKTISKLVTAKGEVLEEFEEKDFCDPFRSGEIRDEEDDGFMILNIEREIRKDSKWEILIKFGEKFLKNNAPKHLLVNPKKSGELPNSEYYLDLKVRSKLSMPIKELPFEKVGEIISDSVKVHKDTAIVEVKFTQRPRSVFHKQSDMMILVVNIYKGNKINCSATKELIFRGGTGSIHSAENKKKKSKKKKHI